MKSVRAMLPSSPAIDAILLATCSVSGTILIDQRSVRHWDLRIGTFAMTVGRSREY